MRASVMLIAALLAATAADRVYADPPRSGPFDQVVFVEEFDQPDGSLPDPNRWVINHPAYWWHVQGRTFFPSPIYHPNGPFPRIYDGACLIDHYHYNPYDVDPNDPNHVKWTFLGGEIHSIVQFDEGSPYRFEARVRWPWCPRGLVSSFFTYGHDEVNEEGDEVDFEFLSNEIFVPGIHRVWTNTFNDSPDDPNFPPIQKPGSMSVPELDLTHWQRFRIYWYPAPRVEWTWINPNDGSEVFLRAETDPNYLPDEPMSVYFNFWAADGKWQTAYEADLVPDQEDHGHKHEYWIDRVEVRVGQICAGDLSCDGCIDFGDINPFVDAMLCAGQPEPQACWAAECPGCPYENGDIDGDGAVDFGDINPFVDFLITHSLPVECP